MTSKVCCVQYLLLFRLISGYAGERLIPGLRRKDWILRSLLFIVTSLWRHKVGSRDEIYSARWKLTLISDQAKEKNFRRRGLYVCFSTAGLHPGSWINRVSVRKVPCDDLCGESESFTESFDDVSPVLSVEVLWAVFGSVVIGAKVICCVIYRKCWPSDIYPLKNTL